MLPKTALMMGLFVAGQVVANLLFKWAADNKPYYWLGQAVGNGIGILTVIAYTNALGWAGEHANVVQLVCNAFIFTGIQLGLWLIFKNELRPMQWAAMGMMLASMVLFSLSASGGGKPEEPSGAPMGGQAADGTEAGGTSVSE